MTFRPGARLDPGEVRDERGSSGGMGGFGGLGGLGGGGGIPIPMGGGIVGLIVTVVILFILFSGVLNSGGTQSGVNDGAGASGDLASCQTGADANARQDCAIVGYVNSIQAYWQDAFSQHGSTYQPTTTTLYTSFFQTGCGGASSGSPTATRAAIRGATATRSAAAFSRPRRPVAQRLNHGMLTGCAGGAPPDEERSVPLARRRKTERVLSRGHAPENGTCPRPRLTWRVLSSKPARDWIGR